MLKIKFFLFYLTISISYGFPPIKLDDVDTFIISKYLGDTSYVKTLLDDDFKYYHTPYIGLGVKSNYVDGSLLVTKVINDSIRAYLNVGDRIYEHNGKIIDSLGLSTNGAVGEIQKLVIVKKGDSLFNEIMIPISENQYIDDKTTFLESIIRYNDVWYDFDLDIKDIIIKKNKIVVYYKWEGSKIEMGDVYSFSAIEIYTLNKKRNRILKIEGIWSEKQFRDQFN